MCQLRTCLLTEVYGTHSVGTLTSLEACSQADCGQLSNEKDQKASERLGHHVEVVIVGRGRSERLKLNRAERGAARWELGGQVKVNTEQGRRRVVVWFLLYHPFIRTFRSEEAHVVHFLVSPLDQCIH